MQVVILAGGKGTRLKPITNHTPKPLISIHGKPFLQHQLELAKSFSLKDVVLLVGYLGNHIENFFGTGSKFGLSIKYSYEKTLLGTGGALKNAEDKLRDEFLLMNGDTYLYLDYDELIKYFYRYKKVGIVTAYNNQEEIIPNNIAIGKSNLVIDYNKKDPSGMTHVDAGVMIFKKDILNFIPNNKVYSLEEDAFDKLIAIEQLVAFPTNQKFFDIGSPEGLRAIERILR